jgi:hypothetical protein
MSDGLHLYKPEKLTNVTFLSYKIPAEKSSHLQHHCSRRTRRKNTLLSMTYNSVKNIIRPVYDFIIIPLLLILYYT